jgi:hypothetical protein
MFHTVRTYADEMRCRYWHNSVMLRGLCGSCFTKMQLQCDLGLDHSGLMSATTSTMAI